jgi:ATP-dependent helicase/nuclease subunit A
MSLTTEQGLAVEARGSIAVTAGAGTGKTRVLAERYLFHLREEGMSPLGVVAITFTERAAGELRARIRRTVTDRLQEHPNREELLAEIDAAQISTIHALCARICRDHPHESGAPPSFEIMDEVESRMLCTENFNRALDAIPDRIFEQISLSTLRAALPALLADPITAERALNSGSEGWAALGIEARRLLLEELRRNIDSRQIVSTLQRFKSSEQDGRDDLRQTSLSILAGIMGNGVNWQEGLEQASQFQFRAGSAKRWPDGGFTEVKDALDTFRGLARETLGRILNFELKQVDTELERMLPALGEAYHRVRAATVAARIASRRLDFSDLEVMALRALEAEPVRRFYRQRWRAFLIDEFQDTNPVQAEILELLTQGASLTVVGDENQSIYGFRRADASVFQRFRQNIVTGGGEECRMMTSFRAHQRLIGHFNDIFSVVLREMHAPLVAHRQERVASETSGARVAPDWPSIHCLRVETQERVSKSKRQRSEASAIAARIRRMIDSRLLIHDPATGAARPVIPGDVAILSRSWGPLDVYGNALSAHGIPAVNMGGGDLLATREARDIQSLIRFLANPGDDIALIAVLRGPFFALSDRILLRVAEGTGNRSAKVTWWERLSGSTIAELRRAVDLLGTLRAKCQSTAPGHLIRLADRLTGYSAVIANLPNSARRLADWRGMIEWIENHEAAVGFDIFALWRKMKRLIDGGIELKRPPVEAGKAVSMMSIHAAKGLEWPIVVIPDLGANPRTDQRQVLFDSQFGVALKPNRDLVETDAPGNDVLPILYAWLELRQKALEDQERQRLLYVGLTRARDAVILSSADEKGGLFDHLLPGLLRAGIEPELVPCFNGDQFAFTSALDTTPIPL